MSTAYELMNVAVLAADEKKAVDIRVLDLSEASDFCDYFLICTAANSRQADSIIEHIEEKIRLNLNEKPLSIEGRAEGNWILLDYGSLIVHVFLPETREYYRLEHLWGEDHSFDLSSILTEDKD